MHYYELCVSDCYPACYPIFRSLPKLTVTPGSCSINSLAITLQPLMKIGSCTNSSYQDLSRAASLAKQVAEKNLSVASPLIVNPCSEQIRATAERDGMIETFEQIGATIMANACGPCIGQ